MAHHGTGRNFSGAASRPGGPVQLVEVQRVAGRLEHVEGAFVFLRVQVPVRVRLEDGLLVRRLELVGRRDGVRVGEVVLRLLRRGAARRAALAALTRRVRVALSARAAT